MASASTRSTLARLQAMQDELRGMETRANQLYSQTPELD